MGLIPTYLDFLGASYSPHEIKTATSSMPPDKALGLDGFKGAFFKSSWDIISYDRMRVITSTSSIPLLWSDPQEGCYRVYRGFLLAHCLQRLLKLDIAMGIPVPPRIDFRATPKWKIFTGLPSKTPSRL